jgi:hypothetical protein
MSTITDEYMRQMLGLARQYCLVILKAGPKKHAAGADKIIWEHGRRNFELRASGILAIVCPINDGSEVCGVGIFTVPAEEVKKLMEEDPAVRAGILLYETHVCRGFPGSVLPG